MQTNKVDPFQFSFEVVDTIKFLTRIIDSKIVDPLLIGSAIIYRRQLKEWLNGALIQQVDDAGP